MKVELNYRSKILLVKWKKICEEIVQIYHSLPLKISYFLKNL